MLNTCFQNLIDVHERSHGLLELVDAENVDEVHLVVDVDDAVRRRIEVMLAEQVPG